MYPVRKFQAYERKYCHQLHVRSLECIHFTPSLPSPSPRPLPQARAAPGHSAPQFPFLDPVHLSEILPCSSQKGGLECGSHLDALWSWQRTWKAALRRGPGPERWAEDLVGRSQSWCGQRQMSSLCCLPRRPPPHPGGQARAHSRTPPWDCTSVCRDCPWPDLG